MKIIISPGKGLYTFATAALYRVFTPHPLTARLANVLLAILYIYLWFRITRFLFGAGPARLTLLLLAFWPSNIFTGTQNLKESAHLLALTASFYFVLRIWARVGTGPGMGGKNLSFFAGALALMTVGFFRLYHVPFTATALLAGGGWGILKNWRNPRRAKVFAAGCLWVYAAFLLTAPAVNGLRPILLNNPPKKGPSIFLSQAEDSRDETRKFSPTSPRGLSDYRESLMYSSQHYSNHTYGRRIETQLFPNSRFKTWTDIAVFIPKAAFYALFMPLPGLYPMQGNLGRILSSLENVGLLVLALLATAGWVRSRKTPALLCLTMFLVIALPPSALFEFDLGSALRHRQPFFLVLMPFAALQISQWLPKRRSA